jgi:hypothetical protein
MVDVGNHALADFPVERGSECNRIQSEIDRAAREYATLATRIPPVSERISSRNADEDASVVPVLDENDIAEFRSDPAT